MNQTDRCELFVLPEGVKKITPIKDPKISNACKFIIQREDHTLGNMLKEKISTQKNVHFCGYRVPHPLEPHFELVIHTNGDITPAQAFELALKELIADVTKLDERFSMELARVQEESAKKGMK